VQRGAGGCGNAVDRDFEAAHLPVADFGSRQRDETLALLEKSGLQLPP
jgi:hypothetical protein